MQTKISIISNIIFKYFLIFSIAFLWLNFYIRNLLLVISISTISSLIIGKIIGKINNKKSKLLQSSLKEQEKLKNISFQLLLTDKENIIRFYSILFQSKHNIKISKDNKHIELDDTLLFYPEYSHTNITIDIIANIVKQYTNFKTIIIAGINFKEDALEFANKIANYISEVANVPTTLSSINFKSDTLTYYSLINIFEFSV